MSESTPARHRPSWTSRALAALADRWPSPAAQTERRLGVESGSPGYDRAYAEDQFLRKVRSGLGVGKGVPSVWGKTALEIGCGHGGISCYLASIGFRKVIAVDLNERRLAEGRKLVEEIAERSGRPALPVEFRCMSATAMDLPAASVDFILADNVFEHFDDPRAVLVESRRVLRDGGMLAIPIFSSILSKHGLHLKHGLKMPWLNLLFSERTIVDALAWRARRHPELLAMYPGLAGDPQRVRDVRRHRDLNDLTYAEFRRLVAETGFELRHFKILPTLTGLFLQRVPGLRNTRLGDVLSLGASALLVAVPRPGADP